MSICVNLHGIYCVRCPPSPHTPIHKGITRAEGRPSPYGWVCGGWEGIRRGKIMPNRAGIVAAKWYFAKWYFALQVQGTF